MCLKILELTISKTRTKLGSIVTKIFTEAFSIKYSKVINSNIINPEIIMLEYADLADEYIITVSNLLNDSNQINVFNETIDKNIIFTVFMRYHFLTSFLVNQNQQLTIKIMEDDGDFLRQMLLSYWKNYLSI